MNEHEQPIAGNGILGSGPLMLFLIFVLLTGGIGAAGYYFYDSQRRNMIEAAQANLSAVADLKANEIDAWRRERILDGQMLLSPSLLDEIQHFMTAPRSPRRRELLEWLKQLHRNPSYVGGSLVDKNGRVLLSTEPDSDLPHFRKKIISDAVAQRAVTLTDFHVAPDHPHIDMDLVVPLAASPASAPFGALIVSIDPNKFLYPLIQEWPTSSDTAETLLVKREGDDVLFLNELRHKQGTALSFRMSLQNSDLPAAVGLRTGKRGIIFGNDYRGVPVTAFLRDVPDSPWLLIAKIDQAEIEAPIRKGAFSVLIIVLLAVSAIGAVIVLLRRQHQLNRYRERYEAKIRLNEEREAAQAAIRESEHRYRSLFETMVEGVAHCKMLFEDGIPSDFGYLMVNKSFVTLTGLKNVVGKRVTEVIPGIRETDPALFEIYGAVSLTGKPKRFEMFVKALNQWFSISVYSPAKEEFVAVFDVITDRKRAEEDIRTLNSRLNILITSVKELASARDLASIQTVLSVSARQLTGADGAALVYREGDYCFYADEDAISPLWKGQKFPMTDCISGWAMLNKQTVVVDDIFADDRIPVYAYKPTFVKSLVIVPINTAEPFGTIGNYWAERHHPTEIEVKLLQTLADAAARAIENVRLYESLEERVKVRTDQLESANKELESFSYSVSHDLRAPLRHLVGFVELLNKNAASLDDKSRHYLQVISESASQMGNLIDELLSFSRMGRAEMMQLSVNLRALVDDAIRELQSETAGRDIEWRIGELPEVSCDRTMIKLVFTNLISNALKYTRRTGRTVIEVGSETSAAGETTVFIKDNGVGFDMKYRDKLFGLFQRLHRFEEFEGTGVGLANVRRIIHRHGGKTWATGSVNEGATFYFSVPQKGVPADAD